MTLSKINLPRRTGGELYDRIQQKQYYPEQEARTSSCSSLSKRTHGMALAWSPSSRLISESCQPELTCVSRAPRALPSCDIWDILRKIQTQSCNVHGSWLKYSDWSFSCLECPIPGRLFCQIVYVDVHTGSQCVCVCVLVRPGLNCHCSDFRTPIGSSSDVTASILQKERPSESEQEWIHGTGSTAIHATGPFPRISLVVLALVLIANPKLQTLNPEP